MRRMKKKTIKNLFKCSIVAWILNLFLVAASSFPSFTAWLTWGFMVYMYAVTLRDE